MINVFTLFKIELFQKNLKTFSEDHKSALSYFALDTQTVEVLTVKEGVTRHNGQSKSILFAFYDPNSQTSHPGWPLRNYLALLALKWSVCAFQIGNFSFEKLFNVFFSAVDQMVTTRFRSCRSVIDTRMESGMLEAVWCSLLSWSV